MMLSEHQRRFTQLLGQLLTWIYTQEGLSATTGECWRPPEMVAIYVQKGLGVKDSLHPLRLAIDLNLFVNGVYSTDVETYRKVGEYWKSLDPSNRWGGDFHHADGTPKPDLDHFEHGMTERPPII